MLNFKAT